MTSQPARIVVAGVEVDAFYADGRDPLIPVGTLTTAGVALARQQAKGNITSGLVGMARVDPETEKVVAWEIGTPRCGWIPEVSWPTIEEAVRVLRNPTLADKVERLHTVRRDAYDAESKARALHEQADDLLAEIEAADTTGPTRGTRRTRARYALLAAASQPARPALDPGACSIRTTNPPTEGVNVMASSTVRPLKVIAAEIRQDWAKVNCAAEPYLDAMAELNSIDDRYYQDSARSIVQYFLGNASAWRGDTAKRVKAELRGMVG